MIESFKHKGLRNFHVSGLLSGISPSHATRLRQCLQLLSNAKSSQDLTRDSHPLTVGSEFGGLWAMKVSAQWRLVFRLCAHGVCRELDYVNYHR